MPVMAIRSRVAHCYWCCRSLEGEVSGEILRVGIHYMLGEPALTPIRRPDEPAAIETLRRARVLMPLRFGLESSRSSVRMGVPEASDLSHIPVVDQDTVTRPDVPPADHAIVATFSAADAVAECDGSRNIL